jgi:Zn-dependent alcohol dehydrogenase
VNAERMTTAQITGQGYGAREIRELLEFIEQGAVRLDIKQEQLIATDMSLEDFDHGVTTRKEDKVR